MKDTGYKIRVIGMQGCLVRRDLEDLLSGCSAVCSSSRLLDVSSKVIEGLFPAPDIIPITPLSEMVQGLQEHLEKGNCAVLASGDPLFFGIGRKLLTLFNSEKIEFYPSLSAVQLACARFKIPWDDARIISLHGRKDDLVFSRILSSRKSIIFTDGFNMPDSVAARLLGLMKNAGARELLGHVRIHVAEELDCPAEQLNSLGLEEAASRKFSPLNIMIVEIHDDMLPSRGTGLMEKEISHLRGLITKDEIRAVTLHRLRLKPGTILWDIGAGSGSVSLEATRLYPDITSFAVERNPEQQRIIRENIKRFRLFNVIPIDGAAPEVLHTLPPPQRVFIGGSGGRLKEIIKDCAERMAPGGIMVANAILEQTCRDAPVFMAKEGLTVDTARISVARGSGGETPPVELNTITIIRGIKEGAHS